MLCIFQCLLLILKSSFWNCSPLHICGAHLTPWCLQNSTSASVDGDKKEVNTHMLTHACTLTHLDRYSYLISSCLKLYLLIFFWWLKWLVFDFIAFPLSYLSVHVEDHKSNSSRCAEYSFIRVKWVCKGRHQASESLTSLSFDQDVQHLLGVNSMPSLQKLVVSVESVSRCRTIAYRVHSMGQECLSYILILSPSFST